MTVIYACGCAFYAKAGVYSVYCPIHMLVDPNHIAVKCIDSSKEEALKKELESLYPIDPRD